MSDKILSIKDFTGGRNSFLSAEMCAQNESPDQINAWCENGALTKKRGWTSILAKASTTSFTPMKMALTNLGSSGAERIVVMGKFSSNGNLCYTDDGATFSYCELTPTNFSSTRFPFMGMFQGKLYISDGVNTVYSYDGSSVASVAAFPKSAICAVHKNYVFAAVGSQVQWCAINDATTWPANNFQGVESNEGYDILAIVPWTGGLVIFKRKSMWLLVGDVFDPVEAQYYLQKIETPPGFDFFFKETVVVHNGVMKFLANDGFYAYTGGNSITKISDKIQTDIDPLYYANIAVNGENNLRAPRAHIWKNTYYCSIVYNNYRYWYIHDKNGKWWLSKEDYGANENTTIQCVPAALNGAVTQKLYGGGPVGLFLTMDTGNQYQYFVGITSTTQGISAYWTSKNFQFASEVSFKYVDIYFKKQSAGSLTVSASIDGGTYIDFTVDMTTGSGTILKKRVPLLRIGRAIRFKVANSADNVGFEVVQINCVYEPTSATR